MAGSDSAPQGGCGACGEDAPDFHLRMAFQPIVDLSSGGVFAYEALVRGPEGQSAGDVLAGVAPDDLYAFDQQCRVAAIRQAVEAGIVDTGAVLSINFLPNAVYSPLACIQLTLKTARAVDFPTDRLLFEFTETQKMDAEHVGRIVEAYRNLGFRTALDDFGAGHSGLGLLARFVPDFIKIDMELVRGIDGSKPRQIIVNEIARMGEALGATIIAEGIETQEELDTLRYLGIRYVQGYLLARPEIGRLPMAG